MKRKAGWLIVCIALASASLLLPTSHAERFKALPAASSSSSLAKNYPQVPLNSRHSQLINGSWLATHNAMPMTPLSIALDIQGAGLSAVADGVGLQNWDRETLQNLGVNIGGPVQAALLYWGGQDFPCPQSGGTCVIPFQPHEDQTIKFNGATVTGTIIGTEATNNTTVNNIGYLADVTSIVQAAGTGEQNFTFGEGDAANNLDSFKGATLFVIFTDASDSRVYRLLHWDGMDYAFLNDPTAGDPRTTAPVTFNHGSNTTARPATLTVVAGDGETSKTDETTISNNPTVSNGLDSSDDEDGWDTDTSTINIPAGVGSTIVQLNSTAPTPDEFLWIVAMLRVPLFESVEPTCTQTTAAGPPERVTFNIQDTGSGLSEILVTRSENADTVVPPFIVGTKDPVEVTSTKINQSQPMVIEIRVTDLDGNIHFCTHDETLCSITCPANITKPNDPGQCGAVVNYPAPTLGEGEDCGAGSLVCSPASGSTFPVGTTTVNCRLNSPSGCSSIYAVDTSDNLLEFSTVSPGGPTSQPITGLTINQDVVGIDFRPVTGTLYGLARDSITSSLQLVVIDVETGVATAVGSSFSASGTDFGFDFNPVVDRIRVTSDADINLSVDPNTGVPTVQTPLNPGNPNIVGSAYTNNVPGVSSTVLYAIDSATDQLFTQSPPASGTLASVGSLGVNTSGLVGFDISQCTGTAYAVMEVGATSSLYTINLASGAVTLVGAVGEVPIQVRAMSIRTAPSCSFTVTVNDAEPPTITCPSPVTVTAPADTTGATVTYPAPSLTDNCPTATVVCSPASGSTFPQGTTTVTCTATDSPAGNTSSCQFPITVIIPPGANDDQYFALMNQVLNISAPGVLTNDDGSPSPTAVPAGGSTTGGGTYTLNANGSFTYTPAPGFTGTDSFNYTATNVAGSDTAQVKITVTDPATISLRINEFRQNGPGFGSICSLCPGDFSTKGSDEISGDVGNQSKDEFIEIYNNTPTDVQVGSTLATSDGGIGVFASAGNGVTDNVATLVCRIPDGTIIRAGGYVLCTNSAAYSLASLGAISSGTGSSTTFPITGFAFTASGDFPIINGTPDRPGAFTSVDIPNDAGLVLANVGNNTVVASPNVPDNGDFGFGATGVAPGDFVVYDRVGFAPYGSGAPVQPCHLVNTAGCGTSGSARPSLADNYCEGGPAGCLRPVGDASTINHGSEVFYGDSGQYSLLRRQTTLTSVTVPQDSNNNANDFLMVAPFPAVNIAFNITNFATGTGDGLVSVLGAAGPQNKTAPPDLPDPAALQSRLFDTGRALGQLPNSERRYVIDNGETTIPPNNPLGSYLFRFGFRNVAAENISQLRFRIDQLAVPCGQASPSPSVAVTGSGNARNLSQTASNCQGSDNQTAVLKVLNMPTELVARESDPGPPEIIRGSVIEDTDAFPGGRELAPNGGGINNSLVRTGPASGSLVGEYATVVPAGPGPYFYIAFRFGVVRGGTFKFIIQPEGHIGLPPPVPSSDGVLIQTSQPQR